MSRLSTSPLARILHTGERLLHGLPTRRRLHPNSTLRRRREALRLELQTGLVQRLTPELRHVGRRDAGKRLRIEEGEVFLVAPLLAVGAVIDRAYRTRWLFTTFDPCRHTPWLPNDSCHQMSQRTKCN